MCCHAPRRRGTQYAAASRFIRTVSGILHHPHSRMMTVIADAISDSSSHSPGALLDRVIRQPLELERERMDERHLALRHHHAGHVALWRNPPLRAGDATPVEFA